MKHDCSDDFLVFFGYQALLFELAQCAFGRRALGNAIVASDATEGSFAEDIHGNAHPSPIRQLLGLAELGGFRLQLEELPNGRFWH